MQENQEKKTGIISYCFQEIKRDPKKSNQIRSMGFFSSFALDLINGVATETKANEVQDIPSQAEEKIIDTQEDYMSEYTK